MNRKNCLFLFSLTTVVFGFQTRSANAFLTLPGGHPKITEDSLENLLVTGSINPAATDLQLTFTDIAIDEIIKSNKSVDNPSEENKEQDSSASAHFDNESFVEGMARINSFEELIVEALNVPEPNGKLARQLTGRAIHTIQDFYSHSNWVELGMTEPFAGFGLSPTNLNFGVPRAGATEATSFPGKALIREGTILNAFLDADFIAANPGIYVIPQFATDFADAEGRTDLLDLIPKINHDHGLVDPNLGKLTSGYFPELENQIKEFPLACLPEKNIVENGKTVHGVPFLCEGLNKDTAQNTTATGFAKQSTTDFVKKIVSRIEDLKGIKSYLGIGETIGFIIDNTGSMGSVIESVKDQVKEKVVEIVQKSQKSGGDNKFYLQTFNDPTVGNPFVTSKSDDFLTALNNIVVSGGGDCPELPYTALSTAVDRLPENSEIFVFSDASAKDSSLSSGVKSTAKSKKINITWALNGSCSPIDPTYLETAIETGGRVLVYENSFFSDTEDEQLEAVFDIINTSLVDDLERVVLENGTLGDGFEVEIPVESVAEKAIISFNLTDLDVTAAQSLGRNLDSAKGVTLIAPDGSEVKVDTENIKVSSLLGSVVFNIDNPQAGIWKLKIDDLEKFGLTLTEEEKASLFNPLDVLSNGKYSITAEVVSPISFYDVELVELVNTVHGGGIYPLSKNPKINEEVLLMAKLFGEVKNTTFSVLQEGNRSPLTLARDERTLDYEYLGEFKVLDDAFRLFVNGVDENGTAFQRVLPSLLEARDLAIDPDNFDEDKDRIDDESDKVSVPEPSANFGIVALILLLMSLTKRLRSSMTTVDGQ